MRRTERTWDFKIGMRVRAAHTIVDDDYHKGAVSIATKGDEGTVTEVSAYYIYVRFDRIYSAAVCAPWDIEPASSLDFFIGQVFSD